MLVAVGGSAIARATRSMLVVIADVNPVFATGANSPLFGAAA
jgi:hypothetical protein